MKNLEVWGQNVLSSPQAAEAGAKGAEQVLGNIPLPDVFRLSILSNIPSPSELLDIGSIADAAGHELAGMIISVLSLAVIFIVLRLVFGIIGRLLKGVSRLPVFKQINKIGGLILGVLQGVLAVYILFAVLTLFNSNPGFAPVFSGIESSLIASLFYRHNFIISLLFPAKP